MLTVQCHISFPLEITYLVLVQMHNLYQDIIQCIIIFVCSIFSGNQVSRTMIEAIEIQDNSPQHGAISSYRFPLRFTGTNQLLHNDGGGLSAVGSVVRVDGRLIVRNNTASHGGGIHLEDHCVPTMCTYVSDCTGT